MSNMRVIRNNVAAREVGESYILSEFKRLFGWSDTQIADATARVGKLNETAFYRLLEALSFTYRLNGVFGRVSDKAIEWAEASVPVASIRLTGINPSVDAIVGSSAIDRNPIKLADYLREVFQSNTQSKEYVIFKEFLPQQSIDQLEHERVLLENVNGTLEVFDGSHRLVATAQYGNTHVNAFVASRPAVVENSRHGAAIVLHLRQLFEATDDPATRDHIVAIVKHIVGSSTDGAESVNTYWIDHAKDPATKQAAQRILT